MKEEISKQNIETTNDYQAYRQEADDSDLVNSFLAELETTGDVLPDDQPTEEQIKNQEPVINPEQEPKQNQPVTEKGSFTKFVKDVAIGVTKEGGRAMVSGVTKAVNETLESVDQLADFLNKNVLDLSGAQTDKKFKLPEPKFLGKDQPSTITGNIIEDITQFLVGFVGAGKVLKTAGILQKGGKAAKAGKLVVQGSLGDIAAFDEHEERLSNMVQSVPSLQNPITEFLESNEEDGLAEGKFKQAIEGAGIGIIGEGLGKAISTLKKARRARDASLTTKSGAAQKEIVEPGLEPEHLSGLGDVSDPSFILSKKMAIAEAETQGLDPKAIDKLRKQAPESADEIEINFARIDGPEDLKNAMQAFANETKLISSVQGARRGVRSNKVTLNAAEDIDGFKSLMERREGQSLNAEETTAARNFYYATTNKVMELSRKAASAEASDVDQYAFRKVVALHHAVQKEVLGARAEAGRTLQSWSISSKGTPKERLKDMEQILDMHGGSSSSKDLAKSIASYADGELTLAQLNSITTKSAFARTQDALTEAWIAGLLTSPLTHVRNLTSNASVSVMLTAERYGQALIPNSSVTMNEANSFFMGLMQAQKQAFANAGRAVRSGESGFGQSKIELPRIRATSKEVLDFKGPMKAIAYGIDMYGKVITSSFRALIGGDEYAKTLLNKAQINALSVREAMGKGLKGKEFKDFVASSVNAPSETMSEQAREFANYGTFMKELGKTGKGIQRLISRHPTAKLVIPFYKTPANIFKFTFERTPLAVLNSNIQTELAAGGVREAAALAKIGMGSSMMMLGVDLAVNGNVTGRGPQDIDLKRALRRKGWQPHSIRVGDKYYSYRGLEPFSTLLTLASDMAEVLTNYESYDIDAQGEVDHLSAAIVTALAESTVNKTYMQGVSNLMAAIAEPERKVDRFVQRFVGSLVPAGVAAVERALDPEIEYVTSLSDALKSRIPGYSDEVPNRRNVYGEEISIRSPDESILNESASATMSLLNPFFMSKELDNPLDNYLLKEGFKVTMPGKVQTFDGIKVNLRQYPEIYQRFLELRGQDIELIQYGGATMKVALTDLVEGYLPQSFKFDSDFLDDGDKQAIITGIVRDYGKAAKKELQDEYPVLEQLIAEGRLKEQQ